MIRSYKALFVGLVFCCIFFSAKSTTHAAVYEVTGTSGAPTKDRRACVNKGDLNDFAAKVSNVAFDVNSGTFTYNITVSWGRCNLQGDLSRAYAIYGPQSICPKSGTYGLNGDAYDCVKYVGNPAYAVPSDLTCPQGKNGACVTTDFFAAVIAKNDPGFLDPSQVRTYAQSWTIPNWASVRSSGAYSRTQQMCQYYKSVVFFTPIDVNNSRCEDITISATWAEKPSWDVGVGVSCNIDEGKIFFTASKAGNVNGNATIKRSITLMDPTRLITLSDIVLNNDQLPWNEEIVLSPPPLIGQKITAVISISPGGEGALKNDSNDNASCETQPYRAKPYFKVYGGDIVVGKPFVQNGQCSATKTNAPVTANYFSDGRGAGAQFAISAINKIDANSSMLRLRPLAPPPKTPIDLSFGNYENSNKVSIGSAWKDLGAFQGCIADYIEYYNNNKAGFKTLSNTFSKDSNKNLYYRDGDLSITENINPVSTEWSKIEDIKTNVVIVKGDINIDPDVTELNGIFIALPRDDGTGGTINTCKVSNDSQQFAECNQKLTVFGSFIANDVELRRIKGAKLTATTNEQANSNNIAEVFQYVPELYISGSNSFTSDQTEQKIPDGYDSVISLPPFL